MPKMVLSVRAFAVRCAFLLLPLGGCQSMFPGEEDPAIALMRSAAADSGPSAQRLDAGGFPMLGAFPDSAAPQLPDAAVASERQRLQAAAAAQNGAAAASDYQASIEALESLKQRQRAEAEAALTDPGGEPPAAGASPEDVLRQIEGR